MTNIPGMDLVTNILVTDSMTDILGHLMTDIQWKDLMINKLVKDLMIDILGTTYNKHTGDRPYENHFG